MKKTTTNKFLIGSWVSFYPFEIHSFTDQNHHKERLASLTSTNDTSYLDFDGKTKVRKL